MGHVDHGKTTLLDAIRSDGRRRDRGRRHHAAHRRVPDRGRRPEADVPRHAGPRGVHRDARPRREGDRHRGARRRRRRRRDAADEGVDQPRARGRGADRRRDQQDRRSRREPRPGQDGARLRGPPAGGLGRRHAVRRGLGQAADEPRGAAREDPARRGRRARPPRERRTPRRPGPIIESRLDVGRGPVATMLVQRGTLRVGDAIVAGDAAGKVRALYDYRGEKVQRGTSRRARRDPRLRPTAARGRALAGRRARAPGEGHRREARRAPPPRAARAALDGRRRLARDALRAHAGRCRPGPQRRPQGRRPGLRRGADRASSGRSSTRRCASTSSTRASAGSPRTTSTWRRPRTRSSSASTCGRAPRRGSSPSARASTSAPTA